MYLAESSHFTAEVVSKTSYG